MFQRQLIILSTLWFVLYLYVNLVFTLQALSPEDEGYYTCMAENSMGNITAEIFINVQGKKIIKTT